MNKEYIKIFIKYFDDVYDLSNELKKLKDYRHNPKIPTANAAFAIIAGFMFKIRSFNQLDDYLEHNDFKNMVPKKFRLPRIDAIRDSLTVFEIALLKAMYRKIIKTAISNKLVRNGTINGYRVVAFDGVELFCSTKKSCPNCLKRTKKGVTQYFHRCVVATYVGQDPHIVLGYEMLKPKHDSSEKGEGELTAAKRLVHDLHANYRDFADIIVYDALACNSPWINISKSYGIDFVVRVNDSRLKIAKTANAEFRKKDADVVWDISKDEKKEVTISVWETMVNMNGVDEPLRYVKFQKKVKNLQTGLSKYTQMSIITTNMDVSLETLHKIIHARWEIENNIFRQLKTQWNLGHCFIHHEVGLEAYLVFLFMAFNLMQLFFFRRLKNFRKNKLLQVEIIERIVKELALYKGRRLFAFNSG